MRDKELREEFDRVVWKIKADVYELKETVYSDDIPAIYTSGAIYTRDAKPTLLGKVLKLETKVNELLDNQKLIMDYLNIQKVEEPPKTYMISTIELKGRPERD